jgi:hypothetical protein
MGTGVRMRMTTVSLVSTRVNPYWHDCDTLCRESRFVVYCRMSMYMRI